VQLLLDTHALIWWLSADASLSAAASASIADKSNDVFVSAVSAWEVSTKYRLGKLPAGASISKGFEGIVQSEGFLPLPVTLSHGEAAALFPDYTRTLLTGFLSPRQSLKTSPSSQTSVFSTATACAGCGDRLGA
jgi:PIN domain nuclease of toxin-antitoxin system